MSMGMITSKGEPALFAAPMGMRAAKAIAHGNESGSKERKGHVQIPDKADRSGLHEPAEECSDEELMHNELTDASTEEDPSVLARAHDLYDFCRWVRQHEAIAHDVMPYGLRAKDGLTSYEFMPQGGLSYDDWPYLRDAFDNGPDAAMEEITHNEIGAAILENRLKQLGHSFNVASSAVDKFVHHIDEDGESLRVMLDALPFDGILACVDEVSHAIADELRKCQPTRASSPHPDGPENGTKHLLFWWQDRPYLLSEKEFDLVSVLWNTDHSSLPRDEAISKVWSIRLAAIRRQRDHDLAVLAYRTNLKLEKTGVTISLGKDELGYPIVKLELP